MNFCRNNSQMLSSIITSHKCFAMNALSVLYFVMPFLLAFFFHEIEEILTQHKWMTSHVDSLKKRFPRFEKIFTYHLQLNTRVFSIAAFEEFVVLALVTAYVFAGGEWAERMWMSVTIAFTIHLVLHIIQAVMVMGYVPGLVTSAVLFPFFSIMVYHIYNASDFVDFVLYTVVGVVFIVFNLRFAHWLGMKFK